MTRSNHGMRLAKPAKTGHREQRDLGAFMRLADFMKS